MKSKLFKRDDCLLASNLLRNGPKSTKASGSIAFWKRSSEPFDINLTPQPKEIVMTTFLQSEADLNWLHETKRIDIDGVYNAILYGTEDCPDKVECYYGVALSSPKRTYVYDEKNDTYIETSI